MTVTGEGHVIVGAWLSVTVTENVHEDVLSAPSVAVQVIMVVPSINAEPGGGVQIGVAPEQLSTTVGSEYLTGAELCPAGAEVEMLPEHVIRGAVVSLTVTLKEQLAPPPSAQITGVTPTGKNELEGGAHVRVPHGPTVAGNE